MVLCFVGVLSGWMMGPPIGVKKNVAVRWRWDDHVSYLTSLLADHTGFGVYLDFFLVLVLFVFEGFRMPCEDWGKIKAGACWDGWWVSLWLTCKVILQGRQF